MSGHSNWDEGMCPVFANVASQTLFMSGISKYGGNIPARLFILAKVDKTTLDII